MSKFKLVWRYPKSLNYIGCGLIAAAAWVFYQYSIAVTWWMSAIYFVLISAMLIVGALTLRNSAKSERLICSDSGCFEFVDDKQQRYVYELIPALSFQSDYFCLVALYASFNDNQQAFTSLNDIAEMECVGVEQNIVSPSVSLKTLLFSSGFFCNPQGLAVGNKQLCFLLLPVDSLSDDSFRHLSRILRQRRFKHCS